MNMIPWARSLSNARRHWYGYGIALLASCVLFALQMRDDVATGLKRPDTFGYVYAAHYLTEIGVFTNSRGAYDEIPGDQRY